MSVDAEGLKKSTVNFEWQVGTETYLILPVDGANNKQQELGTVPLVHTDFQIRDRMIYNMIYNISLRTTSNNNFKKPIRNNFIALFLVIVYSYLPHKLHDIT